MKSDPAVGKEEKQLRLGRTRRRMVVPAEKQTVVSAETVETLVPPGKDLVQKVAQVGRVSFRR